MKKKIDIFSLAFSIIGILPSIYFLIKMTTTLLLKYSMTIIPFIINTCFFITGIVLLVISTCICIYKRKDFNVIPSIIIISIGFCINAVSTIVLLIFLN